MKLYKYSLIAALALTGALSACSDDNDYTPAAPVSGDEVYFSLDTNDEIDIPDQATSITLTANRVQTGNTLSVDLGYSITDASGAPVSDVFTVPSSVTFAEGSKVGDINIGVDFAKVVVDEEYTLTLELKGDNLTPYGASKRTFVLKYAPWTEWEEVSSEAGVYTFTLLKSIKGDYEVTVLTRHSVIDENQVQYATVGPFNNGINFVYSMNLKNTIEVDGVECPLVTVENYYSSLENGKDSEEFFWWLDVKYWIAEFWGLGWENVDRVMQLNDLPQSIFNPETGLFSLDVAVVSSDPELPGTANAYGVGYEYLQLPGYKNYSISLDYRGNYVDVSDQEYAVVNAYKSDDVASFVADIFIGELDEAGVNAAIEDLKSNEDLESYTVSSTNLAFICEENGPYTVVALGLDENGNEVCTAVYTFEYATVRANNPWKTLGYCEYTDGIVNSAFNIPVLTFDIEIQENEEDPGYYRLVNPYKQLAGMFEGGKYPSASRYMYIDARDPERVSIEESALGIDVGYGEMGCISLSAYLMNEGYSADAIAKAGYFGVMSEGVITFPAGTLMGSDDEGLFDANLDPKNPTRGDKDKYDPFWGTGPFCVDMSSIAVSAPAKAKSAHSFSTFSANKNVTYSKFARNGKISNKQTISAKDLQDYRSANPRQFKF